MTFKQCKVVLLPTDKADRCLLKGYKSLQRHPKQFFTQEYLKSIGLTSHHLYILSDDEIKEGDWCINKLNDVVQIDKSYDVKLYKKIIATTDKSLKIDGHEPYHEHPQLNLPQIPELFISYFSEQYNKNNVITDVNVEYYFTHETAHDKPLCPKVNSDNTINIQPIKNSWTRDEVVRLCNKAWLKQPNSENMLEEFNKWIEQNVK